jgi:hypothetical protein
MQKIFDNYDIKSNGDVYRIKDGQKMKCCIDTEGYVKFSPRINGTKYQLKVHRLVATKYIPNPNNYPQVNHINGIKNDNRVENLEWCTAKHNIQHAHRNKLATNEHLKKKVNQINPITNKIIATYNSYREASIATGIGETNISAVCRKYKSKNRPNPRQTTGGFKWEMCND